MTRMNLAALLFGACIIGCETPVIVVDGEGGGEVVIVGGDDGQGEGGQNSGDDNNDGGLGSDDAKTCTAREDFPTVAPGNNVGNPFADREFRDTYTARETVLLSCMACDGRALSEDFCRFADGDTNISGEDVPAFNRTFSVEISDGEIIFHNDQTNEIIATGGIDSDGSFSAVGFDEKTTNGVDTAQWKFVEGTFDVQERVIETFARTRDSASDFLDGGPFDYEYTTETRYGALTTQ